MRVASQLFAVAWFAVWVQSAGACPASRGTPVWDGRDGQLSQDAGTSQGVPVRAADDFTMPPGVSMQPWELRIVSVDVLASYVPTAAGFGLEIYNDASLAGVGPIPGSRAFLQVGATTINDQGVAEPGIRRYRVRFSLPAGALVVPANQRRWVSVYAVGPVPGLCFLATAGSGVVSGEIGRANLNYPAGPWDRIDNCCIGASDFAVRVKGSQTGIPKSDFNCSGVISVQDIFDFLAAYFSDLPDADFNFSSTTTVQDIFDFLAAYFAGV